MKLVIPEHIQITEVDGQWVFLDCRKNRYYVVSKTGAEFLEQVKHDGNMKKAIEKISRAYQVPFERVEQDINSFVVHLIEKELLIKK